MPTTSRTSSRLVKIAVLALLALPILSACGDSAAKSNADLLKDAANNMRTAQSYTLTADFIQTGQEVRLNGQVDVADNASKVDIDSAGQKTTLITVANSVYISTDGGATFAGAGSQGTSVSQAFSGFIQMWNGFQPDQVDKHKDELKDGNPPTEKINGQDAKHISGNAKSLSLYANSDTVSTTDGTVDFWISNGSDTPYVLQMKIDGTTDGQPLQGTYTWDNFNQKMDIKAPATGSTPQLFSFAGRYLYPDSEVVSTPHPR